MGLSNTNCLIDAIFRYSGEKRISNPAKRPAEKQLALFGQQESAPVQT